MIKSRKMKWVGHMACMGEWRGAYKVLVGRTGGKRPSGQDMHRWEDNIKPDLQKVKWEEMAWISLAQVAGACECGNEPSGSIKCRECVDWMRTC